MSQVSKGVQELLEGRRSALHREQQRLCEKGPSGPMVVDSKLPPGHTNPVDWVSPVEWSREKVQRRQRQTFKTNQNDITKSEFETVLDGRTYNKRDLGNDRLADESTRESLKYCTSDRACNRGSRDMYQETRAENAESTTSASH